MFQEPKSVLSAPAVPVEPMVAPPAPGVQGAWSITAEGTNVKAEFRDPAGKLLGFALTGEATKDKTALQKELPAIMA